ncbi:hypothetical protein BCR15_13815 [Tessaracoccus lapidicaptus]|uniref:Tetracyclin repressor-like C-terminal domain-containing protein n=1 Tax=Tessaracoccus lapidicaptus TaxID=1427523 RepID=A0A1C0AQL5_9ACTN|nr:MULTISPECIES: TetR family transcriptional regulator [Tessaracoccus]AQX16152.1 hypothetical protein BKM78_09715 [Tessaracoccus sp. T2.5-30]OCL36704.1 hypothetical protein BCR15_13815 [Tessaracoccus lapidicaptus]VEP40725.1 hypothetical protein TLA_TLA_01963 [Tessaracoccus lapidicaptus]
MTRADEQRDQRRHEILATTRADAHGQDGRRTVADISLNEIARQVGLAKSNVLRYFGSREAILLAQEYDAWVDAVCDALPRAGEPDQVERVSGVLAATAAEQPLLCELLIAAPTVLEHNVTSDEVIAFKLAVQASMQRLLVALTTDHGEWDPPPGINSSAACTPSSLVCGRSPTPPRRSSRPWPASHASRPYHTGWRPPPVKHSPP